MSRRSIFRALAQITPEPLIAPPPGETTTSGPFPPGRSEHAQLPSAAILDDPHLEPALVNAIAASGRRDWRSCAWLLERLYPERWSKPEVREIEPAFRPPLGEPDEFSVIDEIAAARACRRRPDEQQS